MSREYKESLESANLAQSQASNSYCEEEQHSESLFQSSSDEDALSKDSSVHVLKRSISLPSPVKMEIISPDEDPVAIQPKVAPTFSVKRPMTALEAINETILASLGTASPSPPPHQDPTVESNTPLNLVKLAKSCKARVEVKIEQELPESTNTIGGCIAAGHNEGCSGHFHDVSKLTTLINFMTCEPTVYHDANAGLEKAVLKSRLGLTFYTTEEV